MDKYSLTRYNQAPQVHHKRTRFDLSHTILTTGDTGDFIPIFCEPVYPGETHSLKYTSLSRLETSLHQTMDSAYVETAFFFVPWQEIWDDYDKFLGANDDPWVQTIDYHIPQLYLSHGNNTGILGKVYVGSLLNHLAVPVGNYGPVPGTPDPMDGSASLSIDALPVRACFKVWNDWYRDENFDSIIYFSKNSNDISLGTGFLFNGSYQYLTNFIPKVNRFKDVFSTALPAPQKSQDVTVNILQNSVAPVIPIGDNPNVGDRLKLYLGNDGHKPAADKPLALSVNSNVGLEDTTMGSWYGTADVQGTNLFAKLEGASLVTINQLRLAIVRQAIAERDARAGTRINEKIQSTWNVTAPSLEIGRSEFLGGKRTPVTMLEVLQTSESNTTALGTDAGHSKTLDTSDGFIRSYTSYGYILGFLYVRTSRTYSQGIDRKFFMKDKYDICDPMLDNIGEIPVRKKELYSLGAGTSTSPYTISDFNSVWGYQEQYYWLKERQNRISGYFQPAISSTMADWHYGDNYGNIMPALSADWLKESDAQVDRTIAVTGNAAQWSFNVHFEYYVTRELGKYSIPNAFGF